MTVGGSGDAAPSEEKRGMTPEERCLPQDVCKNITAGSSEGCGRANGIPSILFSAMHEAIAIKGKV